MRGGVAELGLLFEPSLGFEDNLFFSASRFVESGLGFDFARGSGFCE
jgi:hypothetical protein